MKEAVIFFSKAGENFCSGKISKMEVGATEVIARKIAKRLMIPCCPLVPITPYPDCYEALLAQGKKEAILNERVPYQINGVKIEALDKVFLGYPNWYGSYPQIVATFLADYCFTGKVIVPFCTHEGSRFGHSLEALATSCPQAIIQSGLPIRGSRVERADKAINYWLEIK